MDSQLLLSSTSSKLAAVAFAALPAHQAPAGLSCQVLVELFATRQEERGRGSRYTSLALLESIK